MGLILDSSVLIAAERRKQSLSDLLISVTESTGFGNILLSAVCVIELEHSYWRAGTPELAARLRACVGDLQIGVTALHFGFAVGTANVRHFAMIPDLTVIPL